jgi:hypothetical protein
VCPAIGNPEAKTQNANVRFINASPTTAFAANDAALAVTSWGEIVEAEALVGHSL